MTGFVPDRFETGRPMLPVGLRRHYGFDEGSVESPGDREPALPRRSRCQCAGG